MNIFSIISHSGEDTVLLAVIFKHFWLLLVFLKEKLKALFHFILTLRKRSGAEEAKVKVILLLSESVGNLTAWGMVELLPLP